MGAAGIFFGGMAIIIVALIFFAENKIVNLLLMTGSAVGIIVLSFRFYPSLDYNEWFSILAARCILLAAVYIFALSDIVFGVTQTDYYDAFGFHIGRTIEPNFLPTLLQGVGFSAASILICDLFIPLIWGDGPFSTFVNLGYMGIGIAVICGGALIFSVIRTIRVYVA